MNARYQVGSTDQIRALLQTPALNLQSWRGKEIEKFSLQQLATSKFCMRALEGGGVGTVTRHGPLNAASVVIQASFEIQSELVLYIPLSNTFSAIDGVLVVPQDGRIIYAQSTPHSIKYQQLEEVCQGFDAAPRVSRLYTHPFPYRLERNLRRFTVQSYKNAEGKNFTARVDIDVTPYVGKISLQ